MITYLLGAWAVIATVFIFILRAAHSKALVHSKPKSFDTSAEESVRLVREWKP